MWLHAWMNYWYHLQLVFLIDLIDIPNLISTILNSNRIHMQLGTLWMNNEKFSLLVCLILYK